MTPPSTTETQDLRPSRPIPRLFDRALIGLLVLIVLVLLGVQLGQAG